MTMRRDEVRVLLVIAAIAALFVGAAWLPLNARSSTLNGRIEHARKEAQLRAIETRGLARLSQRVADMEHVVAEATRRVAPSDNVGELLRELSAELTRRKATDREMVMHPQARYPHYTLVPMTLRFRATFPDAFEVVRRIEQMERLTCVTSLEIDTPTRANEGGLLEVHLGLATYHEPTGER